MNQSVRSNTRSEVLFTYTLLLLPYRITLAQTYHHCIKMDKPVSDCIQKQDTPKTKTTQSSESSLAKSSHRQDRAPRSSRITRSTSSSCSTLSAWDVPKLNTLAAREEDPGELSSWVGAKRKRKMRKQRG